MCIPVVNYGQPHDPPPKVNRIWPRHFSNAAFKIAGLSLNQHVCACVEWNHSSADNQPENLSRHAHFLGRSFGTRVATRVCARTEFDRRASGHTPHLARIRVLGVFEMEMDSLTAESTSTKRGPYRRYIRDLDAPIPKTTKGL